LRAQVEAAEIVRRVGAARLGLLWDPGNSCMFRAQHGEAQRPDEYEGFKELVTHVHCKNVDVSAKPEGEWALMDMGLVDWPKQLGALAADGYDGFVVVETHLHIRPDAFAVAEATGGEGRSVLEDNSEANVRFLLSSLAGPPRL
jgi:sugar phosphate isomerase/epimerase